MQSTSPYAQKVPAILADMQQEREEDDPKQPEQEGQERKKLYAYRTEDGKIVLSDTLIEDQEPQAPIIDSTPPADQRPTQKNEPPFIAIVLLIFSIFLLLDSADTNLTTIFTPT